MKTITNDKKTPEEIEARRYRDSYEWIQSLITALITCVLLFSFGVKFIEVKGTSMKDTLQNGDKMLVSSLFYKPKAGDVVVFKKDEYDPNKALVKRVIATEGQEINIDFDAGIVYVDNVAVNEEYIVKTGGAPGTVTDIDYDNHIVTLVDYKNGSPYEIEVDFSNALTRTKLDFIGPKTVPEGCVFVMGDNRNMSTDSRKTEIGMVDTRLILGKVYWVLFPAENFGPVKDDGPVMTEVTAESNSKS